MYLENTLKKQHSLFSILVMDILESSKVSPKDFWLSLFEPMSLASESSESYKLDIRPSALEDSFKNPLKKNQTSPIWYKHEVCPSPPINYLKCIHDLYWNLQEDFF